MLNQVGTEYLHISYWVTHLFPYICPETPSTISCPVMYLVMIQGTSKLVYFKPKGDSHTDF